MKYTVYLLLIIAFSFSCNRPQAPSSNVVATNAWTAAYALAAGAENVSVLTPYEMVHPTEYELRPGDILHLNNAEVIIYAGYELMVGHIKTGLKIPDEKLLRIQTSYKMTEIEESVMRIAARLGTEARAKENLEKIKRTLHKTRELVANAGLDTIPAAVHFFQQSFVAEAGLQTIAVFGPAPPEPRQILEITRTKASIIIDNAHNPSGGALKETISGADYLMFLNFPGMHGTKTIEDVIDYNTEKLVVVSQKIH